MNTFLKLLQLRDILYSRERNRLKTPEQVTRVICLHVILFRMHGRDATKAKEFDTVFQMTQKEVLI